MNLQSLDGTASKQDEIDLLNKVAKLFGKGTYITDFFSEKLLGWVEEQIKNDFPPELFEAIEHERLEHSKTLGKLLKVEANFKQEQNLHSATASAYQGQVDQLTETIAKMEQEHVIDIQTYRNAFEEASCKNDGLVASNFQLHQEVKRLKCEVYDLVHPFVE